MLFARRTHAESEDLVAAFADGVGASARMEVLRTRGFEIRGPFEITTALSTESRNRVFTCYPETVQEQDACAYEIIGTLATRAYRRSLSPSEMEERLAYYHAAKKDGFENGIRTAIVGILASPHFLFRTDDVAADSAADDTSTASASAVESVYRLNDVELASKLAFFLWSSLPDEELLLLAEAGGCPTQTCWSSRFGACWPTRVQKLSQRISPINGCTSTAWTRSDPIRPSFRRRRAGSIRGPISCGRSDCSSTASFARIAACVDLLRAKHTFVNETLAWRYGIDGIGAITSAECELEDSTRWGLLGKGALLLASSYPNRTSPVLRGEYVMRNIIGVPPDPPPPEVETDLDNVAPEESLTVRERLAIHRENPTCNACHGLMDPLGFALENFDVDGTWRDVDRETGRPIDASGVLPDGSEIAGPGGAACRRYWRAPSSSCRPSSRSCLRTRSAARPSGTTCRPFAKWFAGVRPTIIGFPAIVMGIVQSVPFTTRDVGEGESNELSARSEETQ